MMIIDRRSSWQEKLFKIINFLIKLIHLTLVKKYDETKRWLEKSTFEKLNNDFLFLFVLIMKYGNRVTKQGFVRELNFWQTSRKKILFIAK